MSEAILDTCLADIHARSKPNRTDRIRALIDGRRHEWQWGEADVARAMMHVWPAFKKQARLRRPSCPKDEETALDEHIWDDIQSVAKALQRAREDIAEAPADLAAPLPGLKEAVLEIRGLRAGAKKRAARGKAQQASRAEPADRAAASVSATARAKKRRGVYAAAVSDMARAKKRRGARAAAVSATARAKKRRGTHAIGSKHY